MVAKVQKWGSSQGLRLSKQVLESADISVGDDVEVIPQEGQIIIRKVSKRNLILPKWSPECRAIIRFMRNPLASQQAGKRGKWQAISRRVELLRGGGTSR